MKEERVIDFYKKMGMFNEKLFNQMKDNALLIDSNLENSSSFYGIYIKIDGSFRAILPKINNIYDELVWVHEYAHVLFVDEDAPEA